MKKLLLCLLFIGININCYSQIVFEKGYFINNSDQKIACLIENVDWKNNPSEFEYKLSENSEIKKATITSVKEFGIYGTSKYSKYIVQLDESSDNVNKMSNTKKPLFKDKELFLKVLIEGKASLYSYVNGNLTRYFYNTDNSKVEQLIFKKYLTFDNKIGKNNRYKQQLWNNLKCSEFTMTKIENVDYKKNDLITFFVDYNKCGNEEFVNFEKKEKLDLFNLSIRAGLNSSSFSIKNSNASTLNTDFGNSLGFRFGVEAEYILPFNKNKWALITEPTYQNFKIEKEVNTYSAEVKYSSIELPIGVRHYFFLNDDSKIFINGSYIFDFPSDSYIDFDSATDLEIESGSSLGLGIGYKYNDTYSIEVRYQTSRDLLNNYVFWGSDYNTVSIIFGYSIF